HPHRHQPVADRGSHPGKDRPENAAFASPRGSGDENMPTNDRSPPKVTRLGGANRDRVQISGSISSWTGQRDWGGERVVVIQVHDHGAPCGRGNGYASGAIRV